MRQYEYFIKDFPTQKNMKISVLNKTIDKSISLKKKKSFHFEIPSSMEFQEQNNYSTTKILLNGLLARKNSPPISTLSFLFTTARNRNTPGVLRIHTPPPSPISQCAGINTVPTIRSRVARGIGGISDGILV